jgi:hypothetical protein
MIALKKPLQRKTVVPFMHYGVPVVVELKPGDCIGLRLLRHKHEVVFNLHDLYFEGVKRQVAAERAEKRKERRKTKRSGKMSWTPTTGWL